LIEGEAVVFIIEGDSTITSLTSETVESIEVNLTQSAYWCSFCIWWWIL